MGSSPEGLSEQEASRRLEQTGPNVLGRGESTGVAQLLLRQLRSVVILVMLAALGLSVLSAQWPEAIAVAAVLVVNATIGFFSEWRAIRTMEALRRFGHGEAEVRRGGATRLIPSAEVVPGDILILCPGRSAPADARIIRSSGLSVNEAPLTGESSPVVKASEAVAEDTILAERIGMIYKGTTVADGTAEAVTVATGDRTEVGRISQLARGAEAEAVPLEQRLDRLGRRMAVLVLATGAFVAVAGLYAGQPTVLMIETAIALAVAAIPEGLPVVATIGLARGMWLMARRNALVNKITAVETLGTTTVIFSDKTGTLTENEMAVREVVTPARVHVLATGGDREAATHDDPLLRRMLTVGVLCNNASLKGEETMQGTGDPLELALLQAGHDAGLDREEMIEQRPEIREEPFERNTMMMATFHRNEKDIEVLVKGAPGAVIDASDRVAGGDGKAREKALDDEGREEWRRRTRKLAQKGLRVLAMADKRAAHRDEAPYAKLRLLGLLAMRDPPREDVRESINQCQSAGIKVVMVTGDQPDTACAIAEAVGITGDPDDPEAEVIHGKDLKPADALKESDRERIHRSNIFARVSPEQKLDLVDLFQQRKEVVAMTGDGVNDAPALKKANIGIAMGRRGTDAAKEVADMVLKDDAFGSIVAAVGQGRIIFDNIRKSVLFMLSTNGAEVLAVAAASLAAWPLPLRPLQILFLNVVTDVFPALALTMGKDSGDEMRQPPRSADEAIVDRHGWAMVAGYSVIVGASVLAAMRLGLDWLALPETEAVTVSFLTLAFGKIWFVLNLRNPRSGILRNEITTNPWMWGAAALCALLLLGAVFVPGLSAVLDTRITGARVWLLPLLMSAIPVVVGQVFLGVRHRFPGAAVSSS